MAGSSIDGRNGSARALGRGALALWCGCCMAIGVHAEPVLRRAPMRTGPAQDEPTARADVKIEFRVTSVIEEGRFVIDRGASDGLELGDTAWLSPREGGRLRARVRSVDERSAVVELLGVDGVPLPGARGEVLVPAARFDRPDPEGAPGATSPAGEDAEVGSADTSQGVGGAVARERRADSIWSRGDDGFEEGMPLLAETRAVRPTEREPFLVGRVYFAADGRITSDDGRSDRFLRAGADLSFENPFGNGGVLDVAGEWDLRRFDRPELEDLSDTELRVERLSYAVGGTRFDGDRWAFGRFLQLGAPEFGVVDGAEWGREWSEHHSFGASVGYMPEPNAEFESGEDFQLAGWYRWRSDATELAAVRVGYQKTWHNGAGDRDLVVATGHWLPRDGWRVHGSLWVDFYTSGDEVEGTGPEITRAYLTATPDTARQFGLDLTYSFQRYWYTDRDDVFQLDIEPERVRGERTHRIAADGWMPWDADTRIVGRLGAWDDEDADGGDVEAGLEVDDPVWIVTRARGVLFISGGEFTDVWGARLDLASGGDDVAYDLFYEFANYDQRGFDDDNDDFVQQRLRASVTWRPSLDWSINAYVDGTLFNSESGVTAGVFTQWSF